MLTEEERESVRAIEQAFRSVRERVMAGAGKVGHELKDDGTPVTAVDVAVEQILMRHLTEKTDIPIFGEETGYGDDLPEVYWLIDPIDGTKSYIANIPAFTSMAVLIKNHEAVASVIYNHSADEMFVARKGEGAFKNGETLDLSKVELPVVAYCRERMVKEVNKLIDGSGVHCEGGPVGAGYGFSSVAEGRVAARFNFPYHPGGGYIHDFAPGALLVSEAGGVILSVEGSDYTYETRSFVACHPVLADVVRPIIKQLRAAEVKTAEWPKK